MTGVEELTRPVFTENGAELAPCGIVTVAGTLAAELLELESETITPPAPAAPDSLIVPAPVRPLTMAEGLTEMLLKVAGAGSTVIPKVSFTPE